MPHQPVHLDQSGVESAGWMLAQTTKGLARSDVAAIVATVELRRACTHSRLKVCVEKHRRKRSEQPIHKEHQPNSDSKMPNSSSVKKSPI